MSQQYAQPVKDFVWFVFYQSESFKLTLFCFSVDNSSVGSGSAANHNGGLLYHVEARNSDIAGVGTALSQAIGDYADLGCVVCYK